MIIFLLALLLGVKHSYDADHLIAVSNLLIKKISLINKLKMSLNWVIGHSLTASLITFLLYFFKEEILVNHLSQLELGVALMLIVLGILTLKDFIFHKHIHEHDGKIHSHYHFHFRDKDNHYHKHMLGIGVIHGLASNDELLILFTASLNITTLSGLIFGLLVFNIGVALGMVAFTLGLHYIMNKFKIFILTFLVGCISIIYGILLLFE
ncbi:hypothetical protein HRbin06_00169 [archaeon HR06]|nr:hypothetical protein HRbin06_00169 [archaeon HR06]